MAGVGKLLLIFIVFGLSAFTCNGTKPRQSEINGVDITFFDDLNYGGENFIATVEYGVCFNFPDHFNDRASSVNTEGLCVIVFKDGDCTGDSRKIGPDSPLRSYFGDDFNDVTSSTRFC